MCCASSRSKRSPRRCTATGASSRTESTSDVRDIIWGIRGTFSERLHRNGRKSRLIRCLQDHRRQHAILIRLQPPACTHSPAVSGLQAGESELGAWSAEIVAHRLLVFQKFLGDHRAYGVRSEVVRTGVGVPVAVKAGYRLQAANFQGLTEDVALLHKSRVGGLECPR